MGDGVYPVQKLHYGSVIPGLSSDHLSRALGRDTWCPSGNQRLTVQSGFKPNLQVGERQYFSLAERFSSGAAHPHLREKPLTGQTFGMKSIREYICVSTLHVLAVHLKFSGTILREVFDGMHSSFHHRDATSIRVSRSVNLNEQCTDYLSEHPDRSMRALERASNHRMRREHLLQIVAALLRRGWDLMWS